MMKGWAHAFRAHADESLIQRHSSIAHPGLLKRPETEKDLDEIWWHIAQDSPNNADKFLDRIKA